MSKFFINRPIVAMVIAILMVIIGLVAMTGLPIAQFPNIVPPEIQVKTTYTGADALTVEQSVATPIEQQMSGVDNMNYMYSTNANDGQMTLKVNFDVKTDPNIDQMLTQMRQAQANSQLPEDVRSYGVTVQKSTASPLIMFALYSPKGTYDSIFLANYAYININDQMTRITGIASVTVFGAGQYAMRFWVDPDQLAKLNITIPEILNAINAQNKVNPAGQVGAEPVPQGTGIHLRGPGPGAAPDRGGVRPDRGPGQPRGRHRAPERRGPRRAGRPDLQPERSPQRQAGGPDRPLPDAGIQRARRRRRRQEADGGAEGPLPRRPGLRGVPRHHPGGLRGDEGDRPDALRGARTGHHRGVHLPAGLAGDAHPAPGGAGVAGGDLRPLPALRLLHQHPLAVRAGARHRPRRGRRHRRRGGGGAPHRTGHDPEGCGAQGDGGGVRAGHRHRHHPVRRVHPDRLHPGHHRAAVPAVRRDHRHLGHPLGVQRPDA